MTTGGLLLWFISWSTVTALAIFTLSRVLKAEKHKRSSEHPTTS